MLLKHSPNVSDTLLPPQIPVLQHQRADSSNKEVVNQQRSPNVNSRHSRPPPASPNLHPHHGVSLSGLETINEKEAEEESLANGLNGGPPEPMDAGNRRPIQIAKVPSVKMISQRTSHTSGPHSSHFTGDSSRFSGLSSFMPLRQQSLLHRASGGPRRSSINMRSQAVPRFLAISPVHSLTQPKISGASLTQHFFKDIPMNPTMKMGTYSQKRKTGHAPSGAGAAGQISFDGGNSTPTQVCDWLEIRKIYFIFDWLEILKIRKKVSIKFQFWVKLQQELQLKLYKMKLVEWQYLKS